MTSVEARLEVEAARRQFRENLELLAASVADLSTRVALAFGGLPERQQLVLAVSLQLG